MPHFQRCTRAKVPDKPDSAVRSFPGAPIRGAGRTRIEHEEAYDAMLCSGYASSVIGQSLVIDGGAIQGMF